MEKETKKVNVTIEDIVDNPDRKSWQFWKPKKLDHSLTFFNSDIGLEVEYDARKSQFVYTITGKTQVSNTEEMIPPELIKGD